MTIKKEEFIRIDEWVPEKKDNIITYDGKMILVPFDKIFNRQNNEMLNNFIIKKESYVKKLDHLVHLSFSLIIKIIILQLVPSLN